MINWKKVNNFSRLNVDENTLEITVPTITKNMADWARDYLKKNKIDGIAFGSPFDKCNDFSFVENFPSIQKLGINCSGFEVNQIHKLKELKELNVPYSFHGKIDFTKFKNLQKVVINWDNLGVDSLFNCQKLVSATILKYNGVSLSTFCALSNLTELLIYEPKIVTLDGIRHLQKLKSLEVSNAKNLKSIDDIKNIGSLTKLFLYGIKNINDLSSILYLKRLQILNLDNLGRLPNIKFLATLKNLEECYLMESTYVEDGDLSVLENLRKNHKLRRVIFKDRRHYSHTREQMGYHVDKSIANIFAKKKKSL